MLSAPLAPAPIVIASRAARSTTGLLPRGAISMPATAVYTTRDMTRGLSRAR